MLILITRYLISPVASATSTPVMSSMGISRESVVIQKSGFTIILTLSQPNILVDDSGHVQIADFGLTMVTQNLDSVQSASSHHSHTARWAVPEVLNRGIHSKETDIFSFAMVMIEACHR